MKKLRKAVLIILLIAGGVIMSGLGIFMEKSNVAGRGRGLGAGLILAVCCGIGVKKVYDNWHDGV